MANYFDRLGEITPRVSFDYETCFESIECRTGKVADAITALFEYIENFDPTSTHKPWLKVVPIHKIWDAEDSMIRELSGNKIHFKDKENLVAIYYPLRFNYGYQYIRVFYFPNMTITNHVQTMVINERANGDDVNNTFISVFIDNTIYGKEDNDHFTEKYAIYAMLKAYIEVCLNALHTPTIYKWETKDLVATKYKYSLYRTLGRMYRAIVPSIEDEFIVTLYPDEKCPRFGAVLSDLDVDLRTMFNHIIHDGFNGKDFNYDAFFNTPEVIYS